MIAAQCRAARGLLNMTVKELAARAGGDRHDRAVGERPGDETAHNRGNTDGPGSGRSRVHAGRCPVEARADVWMGRPALMKSRGEGGSGALLNDSAEKNEVESVNGFDPELCCSDA